MKVHVVISLKISDKIRDILCEVIDNLVNYEPKTYFLGGKTYSWNKQKLFNNIRKFIPERDLLFNKEGNYDNLVFMNPFVKKKYSLINITCDLELYEEKKNWLKELVKNNASEIISIFIYDLDYYYKYNTRYEKEMGLLGFGNSLKEFKYKIDNFGDKVIDIDQNVGRATSINGTYMATAPQFFVTGNFEEFIPIELLLAYDSFQVSEKLGDQSYYFELFGSISETLKPEKMSILEDFYNKFNIKDFFK